LYPRAQQPLPLLLLLLLLLAVALRQQRLRRQHWQVCRGVQEGSPLGSLAGRLQALQEMPCSSCCLIQVRD
jgi:hypothetical protein